MNVYHYKDPGAFVEAVYREKKDRNQQFSIRSWARKLGYSHPDLIAKVLRSERPANPDLIERICIDLNLKEREREYMKVLALHSRAKSDSEKISLERVLKDLSKVESSKSMVTLRMLPDGNYSGGGTWKHIDGESYELKVDMVVKEGILYRHMRFADKDVETKNQFLIDPNEETSRFVVVRDDIEAGWGEKFGDLYQVHLNAGNAKTCHSAHTGNGKEFIQVGSISFSPEQTATWNERLSIKT